MTESQGSAFAALDARAAAMAGPNPPDRLSLRDHVVDAEIGAFQEERGRTQRLRFSIVVELVPRGEVGDDVDRILSYDRLTEAIALELAAERFNLVETLAERIAERLLGRPQVARAFVRVEKLDRGPGALGVEIVRTKVAGTPAEGAGQGGAATVHLLGGGDLPPDAGPGAVLVPAPPGLPLPAAATTEAALRIGLLALEQAAWALASWRDGLIVVSSRTELDWAAGQGRAVVWAPAKLVLDTPGAPTSADPGVLAAWLAGEIGADRLVVHGNIAIPAGCRVPVERR